ncbi:MAG: hypothetical protein WCR81_04955 [Fermentimonas sp.]
MRKIYTIIAALTLSAGLFAQTQDSLLKRQMELEREFNPTLLDADKINSLPALREPTVQKANTNYSTWAGRIAPPLEIALPRPGNIMTEIPYSMKRGFLFFNAGNYANLNGGLGYRLVENEKHNLAFTFLHSSTNSDINYVQEDSDPAGNNASMMDNLGKLSYNHLAETVKLNMHLSYLHSMFNYYGNTFGNTRFFDNEKNSLGVLNARVGLESVENDVLNYKGFIDFNNFNTKMSDDLVYNWMKGNQIHAGVGFDKPFGGTTSNKIGVDGSIFTAIYNGDVSNYFLINASPYISFSGLNRHAKLGADILFQTTGNTKIRVVPNVDLQLGFTEYSSVYATIRGGFDHNTLLDMMDESRYFMTYEPVKPSFSHIDLEAGFKIGELSGFRFDIFGGYRKTEDEHFLVLNGQDIIGGDVLGPFTESLKPIYSTLSHSFIGGMIQSNIWSPLNIALRLKKNFYDATEIMSNNIEINDPMAYNKPGFETDMRATLEIVSNLKLTLNYYFAGDRWTYFNNSNIKMDNINDLNLGGVYEISDSFSLNVKANNILSQKYDIWYGYPAQGINVAGGFTFKF